MNKIKWVAVAGLSVVGAALIGSTATSQSVISWYPSLTKSEINPPSYVFGPVWTVLYLLMGTAFYKVLSAQKSKKRQNAIRVFSWQLVLNALWSIAFFGLQSPALGLLVITGLWMTIAASIYLFTQVNKTAGRILWPYLLWVSFAAYLNYAVWILN